MMKAAAQPRPIALSGDQQNGLRLQTLLDKSSDVLRDFFHQYFPGNPTQVYNDLFRFKKKLNGFLNKGVITKDQLDILLPSNGNQTNISEIDVTLSTFCLRSLCGIKPPQTGWNKQPLPNDQSTGAQLVRIRLARNILQHNDLKISNTTFNRIWSALENALVGLGCNRSELQQLKTTSLDPTLAQDYQNKLHDLKAALDRVDELEKALDNFSYNVTLPNPSFVGRELELKKLQECISNLDDEALGIVVLGLGGIGKSELMRKFCQEHKSSLGKTNIIWINGESGRSLCNDFVTISEQLRLPTKDERNNSLSSEFIVNNVYRFFSGGEMIFIFDNVLQKSELMKFIKPGPSAIIITSQLTEWSDLFVKIELEVLSLEEAHQFVTNSVKQKKNLTDKDIVHLCQKVNFLPLALQQAVSFMNSCSMPLDTYLREYDNSEKILMSKPHLDENCNKTVATTWNMAFEKLKEDKCSLAIELLNMMCFLDGKNITKKIFYEMYGIIPVNDAFLAIQKYSLVSKHEGEDDDGYQLVVYNMHILVQKVIQWNQGDDTCIKRCLNMLLNNSDVLSPHADAGKDQCLHLLHLYYQGKHTQLLADHFSHEITALASLALLLKRGKYEEWRLLMKSLDPKILFGSIGFIIAVISRNSSNILVPLLQEISLSDNYRMFMSMIVKARYFMNEEAQYKSALDVLIKLQKSTLFEMEKHGIIIEYFMVMCLIEAGEIDIALKRFNMIEDELVFESKGNIFFVENILEIKYEICKCLMKKGQYSLALEKFKVYEITSAEMFGKNHPLVLRFQADIIFEVCAKQNMYFAIDKLNEIYKNFVRILGKDNEMSLQVQSYIIKSLVNAKKNDKALMMATEFVELTKGRSEQPTILDSLILKAHCLQDGKRYEDALLILNDLELSQEISNTKENSYVKVIKQHIGNCLLGQGKFKLSLDKYKEAELMLQCNPKDHKFLIQCRYQMATCLRNLQEISAAYSIFRNVKESLVHALGKKSAIVYNCRHQMALCLFAQEKYHDSLALLKENQEIVDHLIDKKDVFDNQIMIAMILMSQGELIEALKEFDNARKIALENAFLEVDVFSGMCCLMMQENDKAMEKFTSALHSIEDVDKEDQAAAILVIKFHMTCCRVGCSNWCIMEKEFSKELEKTVSMKEFEKFVSKFDISRELSELIMSTVLPTIFRSPHANDTFPITRITFLLILSKCKESVKLITEFSFIKHLLGKHQKEFNTINRLMTNEQYKETLVELKKMQVSKIRTHGTIKHPEVLAVELNIVICFILQGRKFDAIRKSSNIFRLIEQINLT